MRFFAKHEPVSVIDEAIQEMTDKRSRNDDAISKLIEHRDRITREIIERTAMSAGYSEALMSMHVARDVEPVLLSAAE